MSNHSMGSIERIGATFCSFLNRYYEVVRHYDSDKTLDQDEMLEAYYKIQEMEKARFIKGIYNYIQKAKDEWKRELEDKNPSLKLIDFPRKDTANKEEETKGEQESVLPA